MIIGTGEDTVDIRRIQDTLDRFGDRFLKRAFTEEEQLKASSRKGSREPASTLAKRFAAKEAASKALGTGFRAGVSLKSIGVINAPSGKPTLLLQDGAAKRLESLTPQGHEVRIHLTLSDEYPYARAFVIIEAIKEG
ncbi:MAG TPA: holo-ACP synthase [Alphaproteobacteria bacterium]